jgi:ubiquinone/menaquinone biosynthesis C-methylase UbiE
MESENIQKAKNDNVISHQYNIGAYFYDLIVLFLQVFIGGASTWRRSFIRLIQPRHNEKIAEFCCGTGAIALRIAKRTKGTIWASDLSPDQIRVAVLKSRFFRRTVSFSVQDASTTN